MLRGKAVQPHLQHEVGDDGDEVGVAAALAVAVDGALHVAHALGHRGESIRHRTLGVIVDVDAQRAGRLHHLLHGTEDLDDLVRHAAAVGVAEDEAVRARRLRRPQGGQRVLAIPLEAVEEVLGVVDDLLEVLVEVGDRVADHGEVFLERGAERRGDVEVPRLAEDGDDRRPRFHEGLEVRIFLGPDARPARGPEGADLGRLEHGALHALEEAQVFRVRARPAPLYIVDSQGIEPLGDPDLVFHGKGHALALRTVAERGVVELDEPCHGSPIMGKAPRGVKFPAAGRSAPTPRPPRAARPPWRAGSEGARSGSPRCAGPAAAAGSSPLPACPRAGWARPSW